MSEESDRNLMHSQIDAVTAAAVLQPPKLTMRYHGTLFKLSVAEMVLGVLMVVCGFSSAIMEMCESGACTAAATGVWAGILAVVSASFGIAAFKV